MLQSSSISIGDLDVCAIGKDVYGEQGDLVVLTEMEASIEKLAVSDLIKLTDGNVRAFSGGKLVLQIDPDVASGHIRMNG